MWSPFWQQTKNSFLSISTLRAAVLLKRRFSIYLSDGAVRSRVRRAGCGTLSFAPEVRSVPPEGTAFISSYAVGAWRAMISL